MPIKDKELRKAYSREWVAKRRKDFFSEKKCEWCGASENLVIHHVDPKQKESHSIWSWKKERRDTELAKCVVICEACHIKHHSEERKRFTHGVASTYKKGCRCRECLNAQYATQKRIIASQK